MKFNKLFLLMFVFLNTQTGLSQSYSYDNLGRISGTTYDSNRTIVYKYDPNGNRISTSTQTTLPVQLLSFTATKQKSDVLLNWAITQEINLDKYEVQFSMDGSAFQTFTSVLAKGALIKTDYNTIHCCPIVGDNYYRLKMLDEDGKYTYSPIRKVVFDADNSFKIFPNPVSDKSSLSISFGQPLANDAEVYVYSTAGAKVLATSFAKGQSKYNLQFSGLSSGTYFIIVNTKYKLYQSKFIKL